MKGQRTTLGSVALRSLMWLALAATTATSLLTASCKSIGGGNSGHHDGTLTSTSSSVNKNVRYGLPASASSDPSNRDAYLIERPEFVLSYNDTAKTPNWVCWRLVHDDIGDAPRGSFTPDPLLPDGFKRVTSSVYDSSGFDRGHMCNSKDRTRTVEENDATFFTTNIVPQAPNNNQQGWEELESYCRRLATQGHELYIVCGPYGVGGEGKNGHRDTIGKGDIKVRVPSHTWKVIMILPEPGAVPNKQTRTIAVWMPNDQTVTTDWKKYIVSIRFVEDRTGYRFFPKLNDTVAKAIKANPDLGESVAHEN